MINWDSLLGKLVASATLVKDSNNRTSIVVCLPRKHIIDGCR